eukprot:1161425-Pelagomonas_calceolata.AAC.7
MDTIHFDKRSSIITMTALDLAMTVVFFGFCIFLIWNTKRLTKLADEHTVTIADYAVRVQFVPKDVTKEELKAYFEEWGPVGVPCAVRSLLRSPRCTKISCGYTVLDGGLWWLRSRSLHRRLLLP